MTEGDTQPQSTPQACPSCSAPMRREVYARKFEGRVELDICYACHAIWFDQHESAQLTPGAVLQLFQALHEKRGLTPRPLAERCRCPSCRRALTLTFDIQRSNRISYYRCGEGHGRFTTFVQFLREKNFVRSLTLAEIEKLKAVVAQVRCSSCGAPVNVERDAQCTYCRAPLAILDADAVNRTIAELSAQEPGRRTPDPAAAVGALLAGERYPREHGTRHFRFERDAPQWDTGPLVDLVGEALDFLMD